jgi:hypothetical protein
MQKFGHILWGYELFYPDGWVHKTILDVQGFAANERALEPDYKGPGSGHLLVRPDWKTTGLSLEAIWNRHLGMSGGMIGAKKLGSAPWEMAGSKGFEAEIILPKQENTRLWTGILARGYMVLNLMVAHPKDERSAFEPLVTAIITSLRFPDSMGEFPSSQMGVPLPPGYEEMDARQAVEDIADIDQWQAYEGESSIAALQAFYLRELPALGWKILQYVPFPVPSTLGFARFTLQREQTRLTLGLLPKGEKTVNAASNARIVVKQS